MSALIVDEAMLREPNLLTPNRLPLGPVKINPGFKSRWILKTALGVNKNIRYNDSLWTTVGTPTQQGSPGGLGWAFGTGNYFYTSSPILPIGTGAGNELDKCFCEVYVVMATSLTGTSVFGGEMDSSESSGPLFFIQNNGGALRSYTLSGGYSDIGALSLGKIVTVVRTYSDYNPYPHSVFFDGRLIWSTNGYRQNRQNSYLGTGYGGQLTNGIVLFYAAFLSVVVSNIEAAELSRNPCSLFVLN